MSSRKLSDFITAYLKYTENSEPPKSYHTWVSISLIAGALQRRVYIEWGFEKIYPNMYIVLVGPSGRCRKGTAMGIGKDLISDIGISITSESITREALIRAMQKAISNYTDENGQIKWHCALTTLSPELSVFLGQNDIRFLADLTDWYDSHDQWTYETKGAGTDKIQGVCFNLLGATAPDWFQSILPQEAIGGGFTSRIIFVVEDKKAKTVPEPKMTEEERKLRLALIHDLEQIATIAGEMTFTPEAKDAYYQWYTEQEQLMENGQLPVPDERFAGYCTRRATHIRKLCMIMSASRSNDRVMTLHDFERARKVLETAELNMPRAFGGLGRSQYSEVTERVLLYIMAKKKVLRSELLRTFYRDMDAQTLRVVEEILEQMKVVQRRVLIEDGDVLYEYLD